MPFGSVRVALCSCQHKCPWSLHPKPQKAARHSATPACSAAARHLCRSPLKVFQRAFRCAAQGSLYQHRWQEHLRPLVPFSGHAPSCLPLLPRAGASLGAGSGEQAHGSSHQASGVYAAELVHVLPAPCGADPGPLSQAAHNFWSLYTLKA